MTFKVWTLWAVSGQCQIALKSWSATQDTAFEESIEYSESFPSVELHLRSNAKVVGIFLNGKVVIQGGDE